MRAVTVVGTEKFDFGQIDRPEPGPGQVLVKVAYCGICGSDVPRYFDGAVHAFPQILGHEFSGTIAEIGDGVAGHTVGERVAVAPHLPCGECQQCRDGDPTLCSHYSFIGSREQGAMADYVVAPAENVVEVGDLDLRLAALIEPFTVALHAINRVSVEKDASACILGSGVIGLMTLLGLRGRGVTDIMISDVNPEVLETAKALGAVTVVNSANEDIEDVLAERQPSYVFETAGTGVTIKQALRVAGRHGSVVYVGKPARAFELDIDSFEAILRKELVIHGSWLSYSAPFPGSEWSEAAQLFRDFHLDPDEIITHQYPLAEAVAGFEAMRTRDEKRLKVMFAIGE